MTPDTASAWRSEFAAGPMRVEVAVDEALAGALAGLFEGYRAQSSGPTRYSVELSIGRRNGRPGGLPRLPRFVTRDGLSVDRSELWDARISWHQGLASAHFALRSTSHLDLEMRRLWEARLQGLWVASAVRTTLAMAAPRAGALLLHAAAAVAPSGGAWVFAGGSEAGKTTMTRRLPGWRTLSDDAALVFLGEGGWRVSGTPVRGRERLPCRAESAPLLRLAFLSKGAATLSLARLEEADAFAALLPRILYYAEPDELILSLAHELVATGVCVRLASSLEHDVLSVLVSPGTTRC